MILTVGNTKGGVGKSTLALNLALSRLLDGRDVWLVDGDRQATSISATTLRADAGRLPALACSAYPDGPTLRAQVMQQGQKYQDIVIDAGGRDSTALRAALTLSDVLLIPFQPRSFDVWALKEIEALVKEVRAVRDGLKVFAVLNCADPSGADNRDAADAVSAHPELEYLDTPIHRRKSFSNAAGQGLCVTELLPRDDRACHELSQLKKHIFSV